jgi:hypothetical protein
MHQEVEFHPFRLKQLLLERHAQLRSDLAIDYRPSGKLEKTAGETRPRDKSSER